MNTFSKEERVAFEDILEGYHDALVMSNMVKRNTQDGKTLERSGDTVWRPQPYILNSEDRTIGSGVTGQDAKQLSVPASIGFQKVVKWGMTMTELRDSLQEKRLGDSAYERLASDINIAVTNSVVDQGTLVVTKAGAPAGYDDIALCESMMSEQGIAKTGRYMGLHTRDYNGMAGNLAERQTMNKMPTKAYKDSYIGRVSNFETVTMDYSKRIGASGATATMDTTGALVEYVPKSSESTTAGEINVDNRYQVITISDTTGAAAGDAISVDGIESVHHITKVATGQLKTARVISVDSGTTMTISPPLIGGGGGTDAELQYKNIEVTAPSATASINFLNTAATNVNPFWCEKSIELMPGAYAAPSEAGAQVIKGTTDQGLTVMMSKVFDPDLGQVKYWLDTRFGVTNLQPEMNGILLFNQS